MQQVVKCKEGHRVRHRKSNCSHRQCRHAQRSFSPPSPVSGWRTLPSPNTRARPDDDLPLKGDGRGYYAG